MNFDLKSETFWSPRALERELRRVFDICNGCRRCYNLCPSFNVMFERLDNEEVDGDSEKLSPTDFKAVLDNCYQCKLCYNHCPYTPPHRWAIDFPRLMLRSKAVEAKQEGVSFQDKVLGNTDLMGRLGSAMAPLANWANRNPFLRALLEKITGIHRNRTLPLYHWETFARWFARRLSLRGATNGKVILFYTCFVNYHDPEIGKAAVAVLERNGIGVLCPEQRCCGMPYLDGGDVASAEASARFNVERLAPLVREGYDVIAPGPTCSYVLKQEYPFLVEGEEARNVAARTFDLCEYLMKLKGEEQLDTGFVKEMGRIAYHLPCHLKAQNIGYKSLDLLNLIPGTTVDLIEGCSGIDGTWGLKRQYFDRSFKVAGRLLRGIQEARPDLVVSDCPLAGLQIRQGVGRKPLHPVQVLKEAYGL